MNAFQSAASWPPGLRWDGPSYHAARGARLVLLHGATARDRADGG
jgi:hypothetical protein